MQTDQTTITLSRPGSKSQPAQEITIPATLGSVRLLTPIGQGGMGIVYRGRDQLLNRDVAVKFLTNAIATPDDPNFTAFLEGARAAAALQHASLTTVHQAGVVENVPYIVMQFVDGPTISQLIKTTGPLNQHEALAILISVAEAIAELHDRNIIHRDIKPSNVLLDSDGRIIVSDFGLAHRHRHAHASQSSSGTPAYMAPEMYSGEVSLRSDVYAMGIMGFELLAGRLPFRGDITQTQELHKTAPLPLGEIKDIAPAIADILERATHKNALFRHKSARQFLRALQSATDPGKTKIAQGRYSILQRVTQLSASPDAPVPTAPPEPSTYFDHLSKIAATKRSQRPSIEPPAPNTKTRHCLHCGYNRFGLAESQPCPECGHADDFAEHQANCSAFANSPRKLWWRLFTFRAPPLGWWEVFDHPGLHKFTPVRTSLFVVIGIILSVTVSAGINFLINNTLVHRTATAYLYKVGDPEKKKVADYASGSETISIFDRSPRGAYLKIPPNPVPGLASQVTWTERITFRRPNLYEYLIFPPMITLFAICSWALYRHVWVNLLLFRRPDLSAADGDAVRRAANPFSYLFLIMPVYLLILLLAGIALHRIIPFRTLSIGAGIIAITLPPVIWARSITADRAHRIFPNRALAAALLLAAILAHMLLFTVCNFTANTLFRLVLDQHRS